MNSPLAEVERLLTKIIDLAHDEDVGEPLDDAIGYANKALFALVAARQAAAPNQGREAATPQEVQEACAKVAEHSPPPSLLMPRSVKYQSGRIGKTSELSESAAESVRIRADAIRALRSERSGDAR